MSSVDKLDSDYMCMYSYKIMFDHVDVLFEGVKGRGFVAKSLTKEN